jgi:hypothetical protein
VRKQKAGIGACSKLELERQTWSGECHFLLVTMAGRR